MPFQVNFVSFDNETEKIPSSNSMRAFDQPWSTPQPNRHPFQTASAAGRPRTKTRGTQNHRFVPSRRRAGRQSIGSNKLLSIATASATGRPRQRGAIDPFSGLKTADTSE